MTDLENFVRESNRIEGILETTEAEIDATAAFLRLENIGVYDLQQLVRVYQPDAYLREEEGQDVQVGRYFAPPGGPDIYRVLVLILKEMSGNPFKTHCDYEQLHPFTDGNGRSGRALWAWQMLRFDIAPGLKLGFLRAWYYQTLSASR